MKVQRAFCLGFLVFNWKLTGEVGFSGVRSEHTPELEQFCGCVISFLLLATVLVAAPRGGRI